WYAVRDLNPRPPAREAGILVPLDERRMKWLPPLVSNQASPVNNRPPSPRWLDGKNWWRQSVTLRPRRSCKDHLHSCAVPWNWCLELVSSQPLRVFGAALSPDQLPRQ